MATTSISQMTTAATVDNGDLFEIAHPDSGSATGYASNKQSLAAIADHMATAVNYPTMNTTAKTIVGAINELEAGGGGGGSSTLAGLTDVDISTPTNGQTLIYNATSGKWENGSGGGGSATHNYSTTEQIVGTWIDGQTIYEKTFDLGENVSISYNSWTTTTAELDELGGIISAEGATETLGTFTPYIATYTTVNGHIRIQLQTPRNSNQSPCRFVTLRYTKAPTP